ncbi:MAG TPA: MarR family transcriptional regulator [Rhizobiaceae bacterium]|nr:MarR family transcriptional regulator [Rhizobiaceae bacterium]
MNALFPDRLSEISPPNRAETELEITVETSESFFARMKEAARAIDKGDFTPQPARLSFDSMAQLFETLTPGRWRLIESLTRSGPSSIRALSRALSRDYSSVHRDVSRLLELNLIKKSEDGLILVPWRKITASMNLTPELAA